MIEDNQYNWIKTIQKQKDGSYVINEKHFIPKAEGNAKYQQVNYILNNLNDFEDIVYTDFKYSKEDLEKNKIRKIENLRALYDKYKYRVAFKIKENDVVQEYKTDLKTHEVLSYTQRYIKENTFPKQIVIFNIPKILNIPSIECANEIKAQVELTTTENYTNQYFNKNLVEKIILVQNTTTKEQIDNIKIDINAIPYINIDLTSYPV